jgi:hypothetical protein
MHPAYFRCGPGDPSTTVARVYRGGKAVLYRCCWALLFGLLFGLAALVCSQTATFAEAAFATWSAHRPSLLLHVTKKSVIDKSCIMMCDQWGEHGCLKWVMRCKGDPGYPKGLSIAQ